MKFARMVDIWEESARSLIGVLDGCSDADWDKPSRCPGWSVKDIASHIVSLERVLLGEPAGSTDFQTVIDNGVSARSGVAGSEVLEELREVIDAAHLLLSSSTGEEEIEWLGRTLPRAKVMDRRIIDIWFHEQDLRAALGVPGGLESPGALFAYSYMSAGLARVLSNASLEFGTFSIVTTGPGAFKMHYVIDGDGNVMLGENLGATVLTMATSDWVSLISGRSDANPSAVEITGDGELGRAVISKMNITP